MYSSEANAQVLSNSNQGEPSRRPTATVGSDRTPSLSATHIKEAGSTKRPLYRWEKWTFCTSPPSPRQPSPSRQHTAVQSASRSYSDSGWIMEHPIPCSSEAGPQEFHNNPSTHAGFTAMTSSFTTASVSTSSNSTLLHSSCAMCGTIPCSCFSSFLSSPGTSGSTSPTSNSSPRSSHSISSSPRMNMSPQTSISVGSSPGSHQMLRAPHSSSQWTISNPFYKAGLPSVTNNTRSRTLSVEQRVLKRSSSAPDRDEMFSRSSMITNTLALGRSYSIGAPYRLPERGSQTAASLCTPSLINHFMKLILNRFDCS